MSSTLDRVAEGGGAIFPTGGEKHLPRRDGPALIKASAGTEATMHNASMVCGRRPPAGVRCWLPDRPLPAVMPWLRATFVAPEFAAEMRTDAAELRQRSRRFQPTGLEFDSTSLFRPSGRVTSGPLRRGGHASVSAGPTAAGTLDHAEDAGLDSPARRTRSAFFTSPSTALAGGVGTAHCRALYDVISLCA